MIGGKHIPTDEKLYSSIKKRKTQISKTSRCIIPHMVRIFSKEYKSFKKYGNKILIKLKNTNKKRKRKNK